jgi:hypothetical protein
MSRTVQVLRYHERQLVGVLARCWHPHGTRPVEIQMSQFVRQDLHFVRRQAQRIFDDIVTGWGDGSLSDTL